MPSPHLAAWEREFWSTVLEYDDDHDYLLDDHEHHHDYLYDHDDHDDHYELNDH